MMLTLRKDQRTVSIGHLRRGHFLVVADGFEREAPSLAAVADAAAEALQIVQRAEDPISIEVRAEGTSGRIWRDAGVTGFRFALAQAYGSSASGVGSFRNAVASVLRAAPPWPENVPRSGRIELDERFSFERFAADADPSERVRELREALTRILNDAGIPRLAFTELITALRKLGHDLWSSDEQPDWSLYSFDYMKRRPGAGLQISARYPPFEPSEVEVEFNGKS